VKELRALALDWPDAKKAKKDDLVAYVSTRYLMPWKPKKAMGVSLTVLLRAMDTWLNSVLPTFASASLIRLENQPAMSNPTMKSVQIMLFTLLSHRLAREHGWTGAIEFVHAGTKTKGATATAADASDTVATAATAAEGAAYRARKKTAETETIDALTRAGATTWLTYFQSKTKKSDLADAFLMALRP